ncbi:MAG TPA: hypothetical protein VHX44_07820, partial [Planctomycetota bacterium]|nr:hypothetical protein [Planctomycetota bacterium]
MRKLIPFRPDAEVRTFGHFINLRLFRMGISPGGTEASEGWIEVKLSFSFILSAFISCSVPPILSFPFHVPCASAVVHSLRGAP